MQRFSAQKDRSKLEYRHLLEIFNLPYCRIQAPANGLDSPITLIKDVSYVDWAVSAVLKALERFWFVFAGHSYRERGRCHSRIEVQELRYSVFQFEKRPVHHSVKHFPLRLMSKDMRVFSRSLG